MLKKLLMMSIVLFFGTMPSWAGQVTFAPAENGSVTADPSSPEAGATVTLTVTPEQGYELDAITAELTIDPGSAQLPRRIEGPQVGMPVELTTVTEGTTYTFVMPEAPYNVKVTATFKEIPTYTVTVAQGIENGTVTADPTTAHYGDEVYVVAMPAEGYELGTLTYTVEGQEPVAIENNAFTMPAANVTINATFTAASYTITVAETENGTVEADKQTAQIGETVTLTVTPASDEYELSSITVTYDDGTAAPETGNAPRRVAQNVEVTKVTDNTYTFAMPAGNVNVNATFTEKVITAINDINATGTEQGKVVRYFDLQGRYIGTSLESAAGGIYVTSDGRKVVK